MSLIPWNRNEKPKHEVSSLQGEINRLFDNFFADPFFSPATGRAETSFGPPMSISDDAKAITIECELPGIDAKDVDISVDDDVLTIRGEKRDEKREESEERYHYERRFGSFIRRVRLPSPVDSTKAEAEMKKGVLSLRLPKVKPQERKSISVRVSE